MKNIVWLVSYPKSGNTWFRLFLSNLLDEKEEPADINAITGTNGISSSRIIFDEYAGLESSDLSHDEIDFLRPDVYNLMSDQAATTLFIKVHDAYTFLPDQRPLFPTHATKGVIYIIRNPLDVAVSYANHNNCSLQKSIDMMGDTQSGLCDSGNRLYNQIRQKMGSWSDHYLSWTTNSEQKVHVIRYEDMKILPIETFSSAISFVGLDFSSKSVAEAIQKSSFEELKKQESEKGFREKAAHSPSFFRKGEIGDWREHLTQEQVLQIVRDHSKVMRQMGYLDQDGEIVF